MVPNQKKKVKTKQSVPLNGNKSISFDEIEIITRNSIKRIKIKKYKYFKQKFKKKS